MTWRPIGVALAKGLLAVGFAYLLVVALALLPWFARSFDGREAVFFVGLALATVAIAATEGAGWRHALALSWSKDKRIPLMFCAALIAVMALEGLAFYSGLLGSPEEIKALSPSERGLLGLANAVVLAPMAEEMLFRGLLFTALRQLLPFLTTLLISTLAFGLLHIENGLLHVVSVLPAGAFLALAREKSGGIGLPVLLHAVMNGVAALAGLFI